MRKERFRRANLAAFVAAATPAWAQVPEVRSDIVVTATRVPQAGLDLPAAIDSLDARAIREDNPQVNLSEAIGRVPGIVVRNRQNYAQDLQISSRGFGSRATFGVRGVRLIADGIPATMPDGQGQAASFNLSSAERIEVLRGPFASLYGNSSGGVVQIFTADGPPQPTWTLNGFAGGDAQWKGGVQFGGSAGSLNYIADFSRFETEGYRDHSAARRDHLNAKLKAGIGSGTLTVVLNALDQPETQDPLGLTRAQWLADPRQVDSSALAFNTRKSVSQGQAGAVYDGEAGAWQWHAKVYAGDRQVTQYLGQSGDTPLGSGGVVDLDRAYGGLGARASFVAGRDLRVSAGFDVDRMKETRRGFVNNAGVAGALRRDEDDTVGNTDFYVQGEWAFLPRWIVSGGARSSRVRFESRDRYIAGPNPDDSGSVTFSRTTPVAGIVFKLDDAWRLYANAGEGFETPTFAELAYRPGGATGLNFALRPSRSRHVELGAKGRLGGARLNVAAFHIDTRDEIVVNSASGGRTDFRNAAGTKRKGFEALLEGRAGAVEYGIAYTWLEARFGDARIPGVPENVLHAEAVWRPARSGWHAGVEAHAASKIHVNEANSDAAPAYEVVSLRAGHQWRRGRWQASGFVRVDNVADRRYVGSVIVSEARGRFFEPAPGRTWIAGLQLVF